MAVHYACESQIAIISIDRPERRNAINFEALEELADCLGKASLDAARCLILTGAEGHFCAGADLKELEDTVFTDRLGEVLQQLTNLPIPTIAAISGACMGLGMQLAISCDIRCATEDAYFGVPVAKLGLMINHATVARLVQVFGSGAARHMLLGAEVLTAEDGFRYGFVQTLGGLSDAQQLASRIADLAPLSLAGTKLGLNLVDTLTESPEYTEAFRRAWDSEDLIEGRAAFAERRSPVFRGI